MKVDRLDHIHIRCPEMSRTKKAFENILGKEFLMEMDFTEEHGNLVAFEPFPLGLELMELTDPNQGAGKITNMSKDGVFAISLKVGSIEDAAKEMANLGYLELIQYDFGEIREIVFDTRDDFGFMIELVEYASDDISLVDNGGLS